MVSNEYWRRDTKGFKTLIDEWSASMSEESVQNLSIFLDANSVAGNDALLS
jgi:CBS domain-containing protein